jgi:hypothetical protein
MARFFKLTGSKSKPKTSVRRKTLKWAAAMIASMVALPALSTTPHAERWMSIHCAYVEGPNIWYALETETLYAYTVNEDCQICAPLILDWRRCYGKTGFTIPSASAWAIALTDTPLNIGYDITRDNSVWLIPLKVLPRQQRYTNSPQKRADLIKQGGQAALTGADRYRLSRTDSAQEPLRLGLCPCAPTCSVQ